MAPIQGRCNICMCQFLSNDISALPCGHTFHNVCVLQWLKTGKNCPNCRTRCSERNIIKQLFFDIGGDDSQLEELPQDTEQLNVKVEALSISLRKAEEETGELKTKLAHEVKTREVTKAQLVKEKKRYQAKVPQLEARIRHFELVVAEEKEYKETIRKYEDRLRAAAFFTAVSTGKNYEEEIDKYINSQGHPDIGKFLDLLKKQLDESRRREKKALTDLADLTKKYKTVEQDKRKLCADSNKMKKMIAALKEQRLNPATPKDASKMDEKAPLNGEVTSPTAATLNDTLFGITPSARSTVLEPSTKATWTAEERRWLGEQDVDKPSTSSDNTSAASNLSLPKPAISFPSLDDTCDDSLGDLFPTQKVPTVTKPSFALRNAAVLSLRAAGQKKNDSPVLAPRPVKGVAMQRVVKNVAVKRTAATQPTEKANPPKTARLSTFFPRNHREEENDVDDCILLDSD